MKPFLAIISHASARATLQKAVRETWLASGGDQIDHKFILGQGCEPGAEDEWVFPVDDTYYGQIHKWRSTFERALSAGYDYVFLTGVDVYVVIPRLLQVEPAGQYVGDPICESGVIMAGGGGLWFGRKAMEVVARQVFTNEPYPDIKVAAALKKAGIDVATDVRYVYVNQHSTPFPYNDCAAWQSRGGVIAVHLGRGTGVHDAQWMYECHQGWMKCHG